jgi:hypothetical protein
MGYGEWVIGKLTGMKGREKVEMGKWKWDGETQVFAFSF